MSLNVSVSVTMSVSLCLYVSAWGYLSCPCLSCGVRSVSPTRHCLGISILSLSILWREIRISNTPLPGDICPVLVGRDTRLGNIYKGCLVLVGKDTGLGAFGRQFEPYLTASCVCMATSLCVA